MSELPVKTSPTTSPHTQSLNHPNQAPYFRECLSANDLDDLNIEIIRNTLYKAYLEDFYSLCQEIGGPTFEIMSKVLSFEADRRTINITINSFGTDLTKEQRAKLFPTIGRLYPDGNNSLARADDVEQVRLACDYIPEYRSFFDTSSAAAAAQNSNRGGGGTESTSNLLGEFSFGGEQAQSIGELEDRFFVQEVHLNKQAFLQQFNYAVFYSYLRLKEQEIRTLTWIAECIAQNARDRIQDFITIF